VKPTENTLAKKGLRESRGGPFSLRIEIARDRSLLVAKHCLAPYPMSRP
jgi:hypothetical protein